jgi:hypothetical protein
MRWVVTSVEVKKLSALNFNALKEAQASEMRILQNDEEVLKLVQSMGVKFYEDSKEQEGLCQMDILLHLSGHKMMRIYTRNGMVNSQKASLEKISQAKSIYLSLEGFQVKIQKERVNN